MKMLLRILIDANFVRKAILWKNQFKTFNFQFVTLFTLWLAHLEIYDWQKGYQVMKPVYLKGMVDCFLPLVTVSGLGMVQV